MTTPDHELASAVADMTTAEWHEWGAAQESRRPAPATDQRHAIDLWSVGAYDPISAGMTVPDGYEPCEPDRTCAADRLEQAGAGRDEIQAASNAAGDITYLISTQHAAGATIEQLAAVHGDTAASLLFDAQTPVGRAYARAYADTYDTLLADLRADETAARPVPGNPHQDRPGWIADHTGVYVHERGELAAPLADREAC